MKAFAVVLGWPSAIAGGIAGDLFLPAPWARLAALAALAGAGLVWWLVVREAARTASQRRLVEEYEERAARIRARRALVSEMVKRGEWPYRRPPGSGGR